MVFRAAPAWASPQVKPEHRPFRLTGGRIRIGDVLGLASELIDDSGAVWDLLTLLDGTRSRPAVVEHVLARHPEWTHAEVDDLIDQLAAAGHLCAGATTAPASLSDREVQRYDRGQALWRWMDPQPRAGRWDVQLALRDAAVLLVGVGGTGGAAATALVASGVGRLHIVDHDRVELSNLNRQTVFVESDVGRLKVDASGDRLRALNSDVEVTVENRRVTGADDITGLLDGYDVLAVCADDPAEIRVWANRAAARAGIPWVDAGYHGPRLTLGVFAPGVGACYECIWAHGRRTWEEAGCLDVTTGRRPVPGVTAVSAALSGNLAAHAVMSLITGVPQARPGRVDLVNLVRLDAVDTLQPPPDPMCPVCGDGRAGDDRSGGAP